MQKKQVSRATRQVPFTCCRVISLVDKIVVSCQIMEYKLNKWCFLG